MKVIIEIPESELKFAVKLLKSLSFVSNVRPISDAALSLKYDLLEASEDVRLHKEGMIQLMTAQELINEL